MGEGMCILGSSGICRCSIVSPFEIENTGRAYLTFIGDTDHALDEAMGVGDVVKLN